DQEDERVPDPRERDVLVHDRHEHLVGDLQVVRDDADDHGDADEEQHLPPPRQAERAAVRQLDEVVEEPDRAAGERREQHRQPLQREVRHRQERDCRSEEDHQPAHRRRPLLGQVMLGALLADVLPELVGAEEVDEPGADDDRDDERDERCDQDSRHGATAPASASATRSSPTERDPLTSTTSPGRTSSRTSSAASPAVAAHSSGSYARASSPTPTTTSIPAVSTSRWNLGASGPSSAISPRTATVRRPAARSRM